MGAGRVYPLCLADMEVFRNIGIWNLTLICSMIRTVTTNEMKIVDSGYR